VGESCTAELIQDQAGTLALGMDLGVPVVPLELPAYSRKENWGASETFYHMVRGLLNPLAGSPCPQRDPGTRPRVNLLGPSALGFRCRDDVIEITRLLDRLGVDVHVTAPAGASARDLLTLPGADANVCLYPEVAETACRWLERTFAQPTIATVPIGVGATREFAAEVCETLGLPAPTEEALACRLPWYSRSVDSTYLTGKRVFVFGDATHACAAARIAERELGFEVVGIGTYAREQARQVRECAAAMGLEALITDDYLEVERRVAELAPELVLGTQMERHIAKRLGVPCAVISAPFHVQDCPARYSPQMGPEGANVIFDDWVHPLTMGLEEHLLAMFREDFEFTDAGASHLAAERPSGRDRESTGAALAAAAPAPAAEEVAVAAADAVAAYAGWTAEAVQELKKVPFFVRGKARNNTEAYARELGIAEITIETLYDAKAHFAR